MSPSGGDHPPRTPPGKLPAVYASLIRAASWLTPPDRRAAWRLEWRGEVWHALDSGRGRLGLLLRTAACLVDALWMWRREVTMEGWTKDARIALRTYARSPGLAAVMVLTLALGIGATATIFSVVDRVVLRDLPLPDAHELVDFSQSNEQRNIPRWSYSYAQFRELQDHATTVDLGTFSPTAFNLETPGEPVRLVAARVSDTFLPLLGLEPVRGRFFTRTEEAAGARLAVLGHDFWVEHMGSDPAVLGRTLDIGGEPYEVIGIAPPEARVVNQLNAVFGAPETHVDVFIPLESFASQQGPLVSTLQMVGRLRDGATLERAHAEIREGMDAFLESRGVTGWTTQAAPLRDVIVGSSRVPLLVLMGAVSILLVMVCVNLGGLLLVRGVGRSGEWAARRALGASRFRIVRQLLIEGGLVAAVGGGVGVALAAWGVALTRRFAPAGLPRVEELTLDGRSAAFALLVTAATALLFALIPALSAKRGADASILTGARQSMSGSGRRALKSLVVIEVALAILLLTGGGVLLRSLENLLDQDPGYEVAGVLRGVTALEPGRYPTDDAITRFADEVQERLESLPAVSSVAVSAMPTPIGGPSKRFQVDALPGEDNRSAALENAVSPQYFDVMGIEVVAGRGFTDADVAGAPPVVILTRALAEQTWPGESAIGKRIATGSWRRFNQTGQSTPHVTREVVGVVEDLRDVGLDPGAPMVMIYSPFAQTPWLSHAYLVRTSGSPADLVPALRATVANLDPAQPVFSVAQLADEQLERISTERMSAFLLSGFAAVALLLAVLGIYGVVAYSVALRRREIGIRMAVGGDAEAVSGLFFREGLGPVLLGFLAGLGVALWAVRLLRGLLYEVSPLDPVAFVGAAFILVVAGALSTWLPARRTAHVDPVEALKT